MPAKFHARSKQVITLGLQPEITPSPEPEWPSNIRLCYRGSNSGQAHQSMEDFLIHYGLLAVVAGTIAEGDGVALLAGVIAHLGLFSLPAAIVAAATGAVTIDWGCYWIGRVRAAAIRDTAVYRRVGPFIERLADRIGAWEVTIARFVPGARVGSMLFWGTHGLGLGRFGALDLVGCTLWAGGMVTLGYGCSGSAALLLGNVKRAEHWLLAAMLASAGAVWLIRRWLRRRLQVHHTAHATTDFMQSPPGSSSPPR